MKLFHDLSNKENPEENGLCQGGVNLFFADIDFSILSKYQYQYIYSKWKEKWKSRAHCFTFLRNKL